MDRLAKAGLRYTQFHSTALCSPTRAALITGRNHHSSGFGVISEQATGYPGMIRRHSKDKRTVGEILKENGYATSWFGKNHNTPTYLYSLAGPSDQWPSGMGFDYFYGFMGGDQSVDAVSLPRSHRYLPVDWEAGLQPDHRYGGRGNQVHDGIECRRAGEAVLPLYVPGARTRRIIRRRNGSKKSGSASVRQRAGTNCARRSSPTRRSSE